MKLKSCYMALIGTVTVFGGLSGCANYEVNTKRGNIPGYYIRSEMQASDRAVEAARSAGKDKTCPAEFKAAEDAKNNAYDVFRACHTEEGAALAKQAASMANALCPPQAVQPKPVPAPVAPVPAPVPVVVPAPQANITATPASIEKNGTTTLAWSSENATGCTVLPGVGAVEPSGNRVVSPATSTAYKLVCKGDGGTAESSTSVNVIQPPADSDKDGVTDLFDKCPNTPPGTEVDKDGCPVPVCKSMTLNIKFDTNKADIKQNYHDVLKDVAEKLNKFPKSTVVIEGHTDNVGSAGSNLKLSQLRADAVRKYIVDKFNIKSERITAKGFGLTKPIDSNKTEEGRGKNRRVEAVFTCPE